MRAIATLASFIIFASAVAQAPSYSRLTLDPTLTAATGDVFCLDLAPNDYRLIASGAGNLTRDGGYGLQFYIANAEGLSERIPIENVGGVPLTLQSMNSYETPSKGHIAPNGGAAIIQLSDGLYCYQRQGKTIKKIPVPGVLNRYINDSGLSVGFISNTKAVVGRFDGPGGDWIQFFTYDIQTGALDEIPLPVPARIVFPFNLTAQVAQEGRLLLYRSITNRAVVYDLATGTSTEHDLGPNSRWIIDRSGTYLFWSAYDNATSSVTLLQKDLRTGVVITVFTRTGTGVTVYLQEAVGQKILAYTSKVASDGADSAGTESIIDAATGEVSVLAKQTSGETIPGVSYTALLAPDGQSAVYHTTLIANNAGYQGKYPYRVAYRQSLGGAPTRLVQPVAVGGNNSGGYAVSRHRTTGLYAAIDDYYTPIGRLLLRRATDKNAAVPIPTGTSKASPLAVDETGRYSVYRERRTPTGGGLGHHLWVYDIQTDTTVCATIAFPQGVGQYDSAWIDDAGRLFFVTDTTNRYPGLSGLQLFRFEIATQTLTHLSTGETPISTAIGVGGGRVVMTSGSEAAPVAVVFSTLSGRPIRSIPLPVVGSYGTPSYRVTDNHKTLAYTPYAYPTPKKTYLFSLEDGSAKGEYPAGILNPAGDWIVGDKTATYLPTGAVFPVDGRYAGLGAPLGPVVVQQIRTSFTDVTDDTRGYELVRFRIPILSSPKLVNTKVLATPVYGPDINIRVEATVLGAGLENVEKWFEARVDGGPWQKIAGTYGGFSTTDGVHTVDLRANDALGRTSAIESYTIKTDKTPATLSNIAVTTGQTEATITFDTNEAVQAIVDVTDAAVTDVGGGFPAPGGTLTLRNLKRNKTYTFVLSAIDRVGNETTSGTRTFKTKP
ncbi:hypothetical protein EON79_05560 [bacterium]|nr:MAG: hypothetical protein EON79_05560 [bacterium]